MLQRGQRRRDRRQALLLRVRRKSLTVFLVTAVCLLVMGGRTSTSSARTCGKHARVSLARRSTTRTLRMGWTTYIVNGVYDQASGGDSMRDGANYTEDYDTEENKIPKVRLYHHPDDYQAVRRLPSHKMKRVANNRVKGWASKIFTALVATVAAYAAATTEFVEHHLPLSSNEEDKPVALMELFSGPARLTQEFARAGHYVLEPRDLLWMWRSRRRSSTTSKSSGQSYCGLHCPARCGDHGQGTITAIGHRYSGSYALCRGSSSSSLRRLHNFNANLEGTSSLSTPLVQLFGRTLP